MILKAYLAVVTVVAVVCGGYVAAVWKLGGEQCP